MKYTITFTYEDGLQHVAAVRDDLEQARAKFEFMKEVCDNGADILTTSPSVKSIELCQVEPILTSHLNFVTSQLDIYLPGK